MVEFYSPPTSNKAGDSAFSLFLPAAQHFLGSRLPSASLVGTVCRERGMVRAPVGLFMGQVVAGASDKDVCLPFTHQSGVKVAFGSAVGRMPTCQIAGAAKSPYLHSIWLDLTVLAQSF